MRFDFFLNLKSFHLPRDHILLLLSYIAVLQERAVHSMEVASVWGSILASTTFSAFTLRLCFLDKYSLHS